MLSSASLSRLKAPCSCSQASQGHRGRACSPLLGNAHLEVPPDRQHPVQEASCSSKHAQLCAAFLCSCCSPPSAVAQANYSIPLCIAAKLPCAVLAVGHGKCRGSAPTWVKEPLRRSLWESDALTPLPSVCRMCSPLTAKGVALVACCRSSAEGWVWAAGILACFSAAKVLSWLHVRGAACLFSPVLGSWGQWVDRAPAASLEQCQHSAADSHCMPTGSGLVGDQRLKEQAVWSVRLALEFAVRLQEL